ncbi:alpha/beta hydrolase [Dellaglioa sp. P0083]|uniref:alpha/beta hydrolase n=1 Tax=Dellaglioa kimchii TaxID=3344667 RepID=UPI0038D49F4F
MAEAITSYKAGKVGNATILMLHGTGGTESDLLSIADFLAPDSPKIGIRGRLIENRLTRYFAHLPDGGFDLNSLSVETSWLMTVINELAVEYAFDPEKLIVLGYSNGANVAYHSLLTGQALFKTAVLLHPMVLSENIKATADLSDIKIWGSYGFLDPIVSKSNFDELKKFCREFNIEFTSFEAEQSHQISESELRNAKQWLDKTNRLKIEE